MTRYRLLITLTACAAMLSARAADNSITATTPDGRRVTVTAITPEILKVTNCATGETPLPSRATVKQPQAAAGSVTIGHAGRYVTTMATDGGVIATLDSRSGFLTISSGPGKVLTDDGLRRIAGGRQELELSTTSQGSFYGAGERGHSLDLRGDTLVMYNRPTYGYGEGDPRISQMNITMPLLLSSDGFALVFDDYARAELIAGNPLKYITDNTHPVSYYYVNGASTLADVTEQLTGLTGRQDLPPLWTLGYVTSKYGYHTQDETLGTIDTLRREGYPVDGIVLDLFWYGKEQDMGRLDWEPTQWPDPTGMLRRLSDNGVHTVAISQPYVLRNGRGIDNYNTLNDSAMLLVDSTGATQEVKIWVGEGGMLDVSNPATRAWLTRRYKALTDQGISAWWGDLGEPEVHPLSGVHHNGLPSALYHNQYGNDWSEVVYDMFRTHYPDRRPMALMRGGTIGLQRYSVFPWSGDVSRSWEGLQPQVRIMLNMGLSGLGYMGHDVGGFAVDPADAYRPELYVRWLQLGLFSPMLRTHAQAYAEPYNYPEHADIIKALIKDRYRWLPYNYTLAWENATRGYPLVRPLNFTEPSTTDYDHISDEYLWGNEVLVAPVMHAGVTERSVTFPAGRWVSMREPARVYEGGTTAMVAAPLDVIPVFVRAGAFVPMADYTMHNTGDYNPGRLTLNYYPVAGVESEYTLYDDDRMSPDALSSGNFRTITFRGSADGSHITADAHGSYPGAPGTIDMTIVIHRAAAPASFRVNGRVVKGKYDASEGSVTIKVRWPANRQLVVESSDLKLQ